MHLAVNLNMRLQDDEAERSTTSHMSSQLPLHGR